MTYWGGVKYGGDIQGRGDIMRGVTYQDSDIIGWGDILVGGGDIIGVG